MSVIGFVRKALAMGVDLETALKMGEAFEVESPSATIVSAATARKREYDRQRMAEKRAEEQRRRIDTNDVARVVTTQTTTNDVAASPVHTRVENNPSRLVDKPNLTTLNASEDAGDDLDWPTEAKPSRAYLDKLEAALRATAGPALDPTATKLFSLAPILALGRNGAGPPCDVQADVLPTIRARSARAPPRSVRSWDFYTDAIREARDRRLIGAPETRPVHQGPRHERPDQPSAKLAAKQANMERSLRGAESAASRRAI